MNNLPSLFIDNELNLDEKRVFVENIHNQDDFYNETVSLIEQEKILTGDVVDCFPEITFQEPLVKTHILKSLFRPLGFGLSVTAAAMTVALFLFSPQFKTMPPHMNRFVIYKPDVSSVEITGSFTGWERIPLHEVGKSGYWEITLELPKGVHRFSYILDGHTPYADPTVLDSEHDDFGGIDSIITTES